MICKTALVFTHMVKLFLSRILGLWCFPIAEACIDSKLLLIIDGEKSASQQGDYDETTS